VGKTKELLKMKALNCFFYPKSVAVIGASKEKTKVGHVIMKNMLKAGFKGKLIPINPHEKKILGKKCFPSIKEVKADLAIIAVPAKIVPQIIRECGESKVKGAIIVSAGFNEVGNIKITKELFQAMQEFREMRVLGPNCLGVLHVKQGIDTLFLPRERLNRTPHGKISFASQSGAVGSTLIDWAAMKNYGINKFISFGNALDVTVTDLLEYLNNDKETKVICLYIEGLEEGRKFLETAKKVSEKTPIVVLKGGITEEGKKAAVSHTGSIAGQAEVIKAAFKQAKMIEAESFEQLFNFARVLANEPLTKGKKVQIITDGGGYAVLAADAIIGNGLELTKMNEKNLKKLKKIVPKHAELKEVIDLTGDATTEMYKKAIELALKDENVDMILLIVLFPPPLLDERIVKEIIRLHKKQLKPMIVVSASGEYTEKQKSLMEKEFVSTFTFPKSAAEALKALYDYSLFRGKIKR
jgi:acetyl coenzyme A synthetase (ADP forming)-like protein